MYIYIKKKQISENILLILVEKDDINAAFVSSLDARYLSTYKRNG